MSPREFKLPDNLLGKINMTLVKGLVTLVKELVTLVKVLVTMGQTIGDLFGRV